MFQLLVRRRARFFSSRLEGTHRPRTPWPGDDRNSVFSHLLHDEKSSPRDKPNLQYQPWTLGGTVGGGFNWRYDRGPGFAGPAVPFGEDQSENVDVGPGLDSRHPRSQKRVILREMFLRRRTTRSVRFLQGGVVVQKTVPGLHTAPIPLQVDTPSRGTENGTTRNLPRRVHKKFAKFSLTLRLARQNLFHGGIAPHLAVGDLTVGGSNLANKKPLLPFLSNQRGPALREPRSENAEKLGFTFSSQRIPPRSPCKRPQVPCGLLFVATAIHRLLLLYLCSAGGHRRMSSCSRAGRNCFLLPALWAAQFSRAKNHGRRVALFTLRTRKKSGGPGPRR